MQEKSKHQKKCRPCFEHHYIILDFLHQLKNFWKINLSIKSKSWIEISLFLKLSKGAIIIDLEKLQFV